MAGPLQSAPRKRFLIVDPHPLMRKGLRELIESIRGWSVIGEAGNQAEAESLAESETPEVVIVDLFDGAIELIQSLHRKHPRSCLLIFTDLPENLHCTRAIRAGACGFVSKAEPPGVLIEAIQEVLTGRVHISQRLEDQLLRQSIRPARHTSEASGLSDREKETFCLIGQGLSTRDIADKLKIAAKTVDAYRQRIKAKLNLKNGTELSIRAIEHAVHQAISGGERSGDTPV